MNEEIKRLINILGQFREELEHQQTHGQYDLSPVKLRDKVSQISEKVESIIKLQE